MKLSQPSNKGAQLPRNSWRRGTRGRRCGARAASAQGRAGRPIRDAIKLHANSNPVQQIGSEVGRTVTAIWAYAFVAGRRKRRFLGQKQTSHANIANLGMFKLGFTFGANENPSRHIATRTGDSQQAGEHLRDVRYRTPIPYTAQSGETCT